MILIHQVSLAMTESAQACGELEFAHTGTRAGDTLLCADETPRDLIGIP